MDKRRIGVLVVTLAVGGALVAVALGSDGSGGTYATYSDFAVVEGNRVGAADIRSGTPAPGHITTPRRTDSLASSETSRESSSSSSASSAPTGPSVPKGSGESGGSSTTDSAGIIPTASPPAVELPEKCADLEVEHMLRVPHGGPEALPFVGTGQSDLILGTDGADIIEGVTARTA